MKFKIKPEVFQKFPNLVVAIPVILGFNNQKAKKFCSIYESRKRFTKENEAGRFRVRSAGGQLF